MIWYLFSTLTWFYAASLLPCHRSKGDQAHSMLDIIFSSSIFIYLRYLYMAYIATAAHTATNNSSPFFLSLMDDKNLITQMVKALFFCKYAIILKHCFINIFDISPCLRWRRFIRSLFYPSLAFWSFSSAKLCPLCYFAPWSVSILKTKLVPLKASAFTTAPSIVNNTDAIYFL